MNIFYLIPIIIIILLYVNSDTLRKKNKFTSFIILFLALLSFKNTELCSLLVGLSIIIFFDIKRKEGYSDYQYDRGELLGERLIQNMYNEYEYYPKIDTLVEDDFSLVKVNTKLDKNQIKTSKNIIRDDNYLKKNICNQVKEYGEQNDLNDQLYNSEYGIYQFENDQTIQNQGSNEWWDRYNQLENNKSSIQNKLDINSGQIIDLQKDGKIITDNLLNNREKLKQIRDKINQNLDKIDKNQRCLLYGMDEVTQKYLKPKKQNVHYGETLAPDGYSPILKKEIFSIEDIMNAYKKNPDLINECIKNIMDNNSNDGQDSGGNKNNCKPIVETDQINLSTGRVFYN